MKFPLSRNSGNKGKQTVRVAVCHESVLCLRYYGKDFGQALMFARQTPFVEPVPQGLGMIKILILPRFRHGNITPFEI